MSILCTAARAQSKAEQGAATAPGVDRPGANIQHLVFDAPTAGAFDLRVDQCSTACWMNNACLAWTYVKPGTTQGPKGNCWLKKTVPPPSTNACCISGYFEMQIIR